MPALSISGRMVDWPAAFPFFSCSSAFSISLDVGMLPRLSLTSLCLTRPNISSNWLLMLNTLVKCFLPCCFSAQDVILAMYGNHSRWNQPSFSSLHVPDCRLHLLSSNLSLSIISATSWNHAFFTFLTALLAATLVSLNLARSSSFSVPSHLE